MEATEISLEQYVESKGANIHETHEHFKPIPLRHHNRLETGL